MTSNKKIKPHLIEELPVFLEQTNLSTDEKNKVIIFTKKYEKNSKGLIQSIISVTLNFIGAFLVGLSTVFFIDLIGIKNIQNIAPTLLIISITLYFLPGLYFNKVNNPLIGNTLIFIALLIGYLSIYGNIYLFCVLFCMNLIGLIFSKSRFLTVFLVVSLNFLTIFFLIFYAKNSNSLNLIQSITVSNLILLFISVKTKHLFSLLKQYYLVQPIITISLINFFTFLFILSFLKTGSTYEYFSYNIIYFLLSTVFLVWSFKYEVPLYRVIAITSWFTFLFYKYYDLLWKFLHKSVSLLIFGLIFIGIGIILNKRSALYA